MFTDKIIKAIYARSVREEQFAAIQQFIKAPEGGKLLDIGTGNDRLLLKLKDSGLKLYAVDITPPDRPRTMDEISLIGYSSIEEIFYPDDFFDCVTTIDTPELWEDKMTALTEIKRVMKAGTQFICVFGFDSKTGEGTPPRTLRAQARKAGFVNVSVKILRAEGRYLLTGEKPC